MPREPGVVNERRWRAAVEAFVGTQQAREEAERRRRQKHIKDIVAIYNEAIEDGSALAFAMVDVGKELMNIMSRAEQIEMLAAILGRVRDRHRDDAIELICTLVVYAKPRANAPRGEIAGVSMFNTVVRRSTAAAKRRPNQ